MIQNPITIDRLTSFRLEISREKMNYLNNHRIYGITKRFEQRPKRGVNFYRSAAALKVSLQLPQIYIQPVPSASAIEYVRVRVRTCIIMHNMLALALHIFSRN